MLVSMKDIFVDREATLKLLLEFASATKKGDPARLAIIGPRKIGKTALLWKFQNLSRDLPVVYFDINSIMGTPKEFAWRYLGTMIRAIEGRDINVFDTGEVRRAAEQSRNMAFLKVALALENADDITAITTALDLPQRFEERMIVILDEFQGLMKADRFKQIANIMHLVRDVMQRSKNGYIISGSEVSILEDILQNSNSPLFGQFTIRYLGPLPPEDTKRLCKALLKPFDKGIDKAASNYLAKVTDRTPYYTMVVTNDMAMTLMVQDRPNANLDDARRSIYNTVVSRQGELYRYFEYLFDLLTKRTESLRVKDALLHLCRREMGIHQMANVMGISDAESSTILKKLRELDIIACHKDAFTVPDMLFRFWLNEAFFYSAMPEVHRGLEESLAILEERYLKAKTMLGLAFEAQMREMMRRFKGQEVEGAMFGIEGRITLPNATEVEPVDLGELGELDGALVSGEVWVLEVKSTTRPAGRKDLNKFEKAVRAFELSRDLKVSRKWFVSTEGFSKGAIEDAKKMGMLTSNSKDVAMIAQKLGYRMI